jgi:hypothetical protein
MPITLLSPTLRVTKTDCVLASLLARSWLKGLRKRRIRRLDDCAVDGAEAWLATRFLEWANCLGEHLRERP